MHGEQTRGDRLDAPGLTHDCGLRVQAVALTMWRHEIVPELGVCKACGRLPVRELPLFGRRCRIAVDEWDLAEAALRRLVGGPPERNKHREGAPHLPRRTVGRAAVPPQRNLDRPRP